MDKREYHRRSKSSIKHCSYPKKWVKRSNPNLRPKRYCRTPSKPDAMRKSACVDAGGAWIKRKKAGLKRKQGYCRMTHAEAEDAVVEAEQEVAEARQEVRELERKEAKAEQRLLDLSRDLPWEAGRRMKSKKSKSRKSKMSKKSKSRKSKMSKKSKKSKK